MSRAAVLVLTGFIAVFATAALAWSAAAALQQEPEVRRGEPVTICHATGNGKYVLQSPDADSIVSEHGHGSHPERHHPALRLPTVGPGPGRPLSRPELGQRGKRSWTTAAWSPCRPPRSTRSATSSSASTTSPTARSPQRSATSNPNAIPVNLERGAREQRERRVRRQAADDVPARQGRRLRSRSRTSPPDGRDLDARERAAGTRPRRRPPPTLEDEVHAAGPASRHRTPGSSSHAWRTGRARSARRSGTGTTGTRSSSPSVRRTHSPRRRATAGSRPSSCRETTPLSSRCRGSRTARASRGRSPRATPAARARPSPTATADFPTKCGVDPPDPSPTRLIHRIRRIRPTRPIRRRWVRTRTRSASSSSA